MFFDLHYLYWSKPNIMWMEDSEIGNDRKPTIDHD